MRIRIIGGIVAVLLAAVGAFAVILYVQDADRRAAAGAEFVDVYVVDELVPSGTAGSDVGEFVSLKSLPALAVSTDRVLVLDDVVGLVATADLLPGDQLVLARFASPEVLAARGDVAVPDGMQEVTIAFPLERVVGGSVVAGSTVGVVVTSTDADGSTTQFVFHKVLVTRTQPGDSISSGSDETDSGPVSTIMVTLAATTPQVEKLVWAAELWADNLAGIWLTLEPASASETGSAAVTEGNIFP